MNTMSTNPGTLPDVTGRRWVIRDKGRPVTMNVYRTEHFQERGRQDAETRGRFKTLALEARIPPLASIIVSFVPFCRHGTKLPDPGACIAMAKAAVDGLVDAKVVPDDCGPFVAGIVFVPPEHADRDVLVVLIEEVADGDPA